MIIACVNNNKTMGKNAAVLTVVCLLLCLSLHYTFPLHKETTKLVLLENHAEREKQQMNDGFVGRSKKMAANIEHAIKKFIDSTPNRDKPKQVAKCSPVALDSDLSNYEQLVIMKKYPFLDLQEIDLNYRPSSNKNNGQSLNSAPNIMQDPSFCESSVEGPNVEITNRGLSGFALPMKLVKTENTDEIKIHSNNSQPSKARSSSSTPAQNDINLLENLEEEIRKFEEHMT